jgi:carbamate kinase
MLIVVALGGNALLRRGESLDADVQRRNVKSAAHAIAKLAREHEVVVTHGNGPQVGLLALQTAAYTGTKPYPLDVLDAESEGMIGYMLDQALGNELPRRDIATLLTQVIVDGDDPAFKNPTKPVGPVYEKEAAERLAAERGWSVAPDGDKWRRVVPSPVPRDIVELNTIEFLVDGNIIVICTGGGGIPVVLDADGALHGVEAVVDKDASSALLAALLGADRLLLLTDVSGVSADWGTPNARLISRADPEELMPSQFESGSMRPKIIAACDFVMQTGRDAVIGSLDDVEAILAGEAGTTISVRPEGMTSADRVG